MAYSDDDDLGDFIVNTDALPDPFTAYHDKAEEAINRSLLAAGVSQDTLDDLSAATLADLVGPSVHYALYQFFQGFPADPSLLERARFHKKEYDGAMRIIKIEDSSGSESVPSYGKVRLG